MRRKPIAIYLGILLVTATTGIALPLTSAATQLRLALFVGETIGVAKASGTTPAFPAQTSSLTRAFSSGSPQRYRIILSIRSELEGKRPLAIGSKTYVEPVSRAVEMRTSWRATRRVVQVLADGSAEIEETLDEFDALQESTAPGDDETQKMSVALRNAFEKWKQPLMFRYRESPAGQLLGLQPDAMPAIGENAPPLLSLWLLRALRPTVALPAKPVRFGERWQEPRAVQLKGWSQAQGSESGEWLEASGASEPAVRLYVVQQISGTVDGAEIATQGPVPQGRFHADALATISLLDARLLRVERSALREVSWVLESVPGLPEPQRFSARLSVYVHIQDCQNDPCLASRRDSL